MIVKNSYRKAAEKNLNEVMGVVIKFNIVFDKRSMNGLPSR